MSPDPGPAAPPGSPALMGQDGALSGHEVLGGEAVQLLGKSAEHLLIRPAPSQRYDSESSFTLIDCLHCNVYFKIATFSLQRVPSEGGNPALRRL